MLKSVRSQTLVVLAAGALIGYLAATDGFRVTRSCARCITWIANRSESSAWTLVLFRLDVAVSAIQEI